MLPIPRLRSERFAEEGNLCSFGIGDFLVPEIEAVLPIAAGPAGIIADIGVGAAAGAGLSALTGGKPGLGALTGGITGGAIGGFGGPLGDVLGGPVAGDIAAGAAGGLVGSAITGQSPLSGALTGAAAGGLAGLTGGGPTAGSDAPSALAAAPGQGAAGGGASASSAAAPSAAAAPSQLDFTQPAAGGMDFIGGVPATGVSGAPTTTGAAGGTGMADFSGAPGQGITDLMAQNPLLGPIQPNSGAIPGAATGTGATGLIPGGASGNFISQLTSNPGAMIGLGGLALAGMREMQPLPEQQALNEIAAKQLGMSGNLMNYINTGTLPPGMQAAVSEATASAKAEARGNFARMGLTGSSMEAESMQRIDQAAATQAAGLADKLLSQGIQLSGMAASEFTNLLNITLQQDAAFQQALGNFTRGLAGGTGVAGQAVQTTAAA